MLSIVYSTSASMQHIQQGCNITVCNSPVPAIVCCGSRQLKRRAGGGGGQADEQQQQQQDWSHNWQSVLTCSAAFETYAREAACTGHANTAQAGQPVMKKPRCSSTAAHAMLSCTLFQTVGCPWLGKTCVCSPPGNSPFRCEGGSRSGKILALRLRVRRQQAGGKNVP
jgi:hypothetical protein